MRVHVSDALGAAIDAVQGFRWIEYSPFFAILAVQILFLALTTQLHHGWAMGAVAPIVGWTGGIQHLHYPAFFGYLTVVMGWIETFLYAVAGSVLIPLSLLRLYARTDRALSLGAGAGTRLAGAVLPTLLAGLAIVGVLWGWQRWVAPWAAPVIRRTMPGPGGDFVTWLFVILGGYLAFSLLLYVPVAAVQARTNPVRAFGRGLRFGLRAIGWTLLFTLIFGVPAIAVQYVLEQNAAVLVTKMAPEIVAGLLALYAILTSIATYLTYATAARLYRVARGEE
jgi:hypothetical protein